jgi:8-oxo-dGTP diphosphatase
MTPIQVTCGIIFKDGKILAAQRSEKMSLPLKWEFPGGKLVDGETEEACLKREIQEELHISIKIQRRLYTVTHDYGTFIIELIPFVAEYTSGSLQLQEHFLAGWYTLAELQDLDWAPADLPVLQQVNELY